MLAYTLVGMVVALALLLIRVTARKPSSKGDWLLALFLATVAFLDATYLSMMLPIYRLLATSFPST